MHEDPTAQSQRATRALHRGSGGDASTRLRIVRGSHSTSLLAEAVEDKSPYVARAAIQRLIEVDNAAAGAVLRAIMLDSDPSLVKDIATALRKIGDNQAVKTARTALTEEPYSHRVAAAIVLGAFRDQSAIGPLTAALNDEIAAVRVAVLDALATLRLTPEIARRCGELLSDAHSQVRIAAVRIVASRSQDPSGSLALLTQDPDQLVRLELASHVGALASEDATRLLADNNEWVRQRAALSAPPGRHLADLARLLANDPSSHVRRAAARALAQDVTDVSIEPLLRGIEDPDPLVRAASLRSLEQRLTRAGVIAKIVDQLTSARPERRRFGVYALARLRAADLGSAVWRLADDPDLYVRLALIETAATLVAEPEPLLRYMATDPATPVRTSAENFLARVAPEGETPSSPCDELMDRPEMEGQPLA